MMPLTLTTATCLLGFRGRRFIFCAARVKAAEVGAYARRRKRTVACDATSGDIRLGASRSGHYIG